MTRTDPKKQKEGPTRPSENDRGRRQEEFERSLDRFNLSPHIREMILEGGPPPNWAPSSC